MKNLFTDISLLCQTAAAGTSAAAAAGGSSSAAAAAAGGSSSSSAAAAATAAAAAASVPAAAAASNIPTLNPTCNAVHCSNVYGKHCKYYLALLFIYKFIGSVGIIK